MDKGKYVTPLLPARLHDAAAARGLTVRSSSIILEVARH